MEHPGEQVSTETRKLNFFKIVLKMIIDQTGKIGIGTQNPLSTLHITSTDG